ncbi:hypothetical protein [Sphingobium sp. WCS2017Hpa-17]|uniref:hypothetical protein n=1 Tax=Sphingobium sp. WCS2017Hpa-17 TaxID=3073638 RepID=UPI002889A050|nr:hypothetical protein [Sphingobium sp. WCS2017Hpa-17]
MSLICLRNEPGVGPLEWEVEQHGWRDDLIESAHDLADDLFGICELDIELVMDLADPRFEFQRLMRDEADVYWAQLGWDVTDGEGKQLRVMEYLSGPLLCAVKRLHPAARFTRADEAWGAKLEADAKQFNAGHRR